VVILNRRAGQVNEGEESAGVRANILPLPPPEGDMLAHMLAQSRTAGLPSLWRG